MSKLDNTIEMKKLVVLSGAGMSAESGISTFRESGGLWEQHDVMEVASYDGWLRNPELVLRFYNERRHQLSKVEPNQGHKLLVKLAHRFDVHVITQNVDNLHEQAGSKKVLHLHGELTKARSTIDPGYIVDIAYKPIKIGDQCPNGGQMRPHIVWFGEEVPTMTEAIRIVEDAEVFLVIGTSLNVYPAAGLINYVPSKCPIYLIDPNPVQVPVSRKYTFIQEKASTGLKKFSDLIMS